MQSNTSRELDVLPYREKISPVAAMLKQHGVHYGQEDLSRASWTKAKYKRGKHKTLRGKRGGE